MKGYCLNMFTWNFELDEVDILGKIFFQRDFLSTLVFVLGLIPSSLVLSKAKSVYEFARS